MSAAQLIPFEALDAKVHTWSERANALTITTQGELEAVAGFLQGVKAMKKEIADTFDPIDTAQKEARRVTIEQRKKVEQPLDEAEAIAKRKVGTYIAEQERAAKAAAALAEATAREEREKAERAAKEAEASGEVELADAIREESNVTAAPIIAAPVPRVAGISTRSVWKHRVKDFRALVEAVAAGKVPLEVLKADDVVLGQTARALKRSLNYPGVEVWEDSAVSVR